MKLNQIPDRSAERFPEKVTISISKEADETIQKLRDMGKNTAELLRRVVEKTLKEVREKNKIS